jgi:hypothetical protein
MKWPFFDPFSSILEELQTRHCGFVAAMAGDGEIAVGMI